MDIKDTELKLANYHDPRVATLTELNKVRPRHEADPAAEEHRARPLDDEDYFTDRDSDDATMEDLMPELVPVSGVVGMLLTVVIAVAVALAVYAARTMLNG